MANLNRHFKVNESILLLEESVDMIKLSISLYWLPSLCAPSKIS